jgi:hypothetical protein
MALQKGGPTAVTAIMFTTNTTLSSLIGLTYLDDRVRAGFAAPGVLAVVLPSLMVRSVQVSPAQTRCVVGQAAAGGIRGAHTATVASRRRCRGAESDPDRIMRIPWMRTYEADDAGFQLRDDWFDVGRDRHRTPSTQLFAWPPRSGAIPRLYSMALTR